MLSVQNIVRLLCGACETITKAVKAVGKALERCFAAFKEYKPMEYIPPKHRQMRYCWNKSRNWKRARGWQ